VHGTVEHPLAVELHVELGGVGDGRKNSRRGRASVTS